MQGIPVFAEASLSKKEPTCFHAKFKLNPEQVVTL